MENSDRMWSTGERKGNPLQYSCLEICMNSMKRQNDRILKEELPRSVGTQYATGDQWRNNSRKNEGMEPKQKQYPVVPLQCSCLENPRDGGAWGVAVYGVAQSRTSTTGYCFCFGSFPSFFLELFLY